MKRNNKIKHYNDLFVKNKDRRVEYGNTQNSFQYFRKFKIKKTAEILDIGTNIGTLPYLIHKAGWKKVRGIDITKEAIKYGKKEYPQIAKKLKVYSGKKLPYVDNSFDVITSFDVIEHIPRPSKFLDEIRRVLKPDGLFIFQTPNKIINVPWEIINQGSFVKWREEHCSLQTLNSLNQILIERGFREILIEKFSIDTEYNREKIRRKLGAIFILLLYVLNKAPLNVFPNLWGCAKK